MQVLDHWLENLQPSQRVLDLGCGSGSLNYAHYGTLNVFGVDVVFPKSASRRLIAVSADGHRLPFAAASFDLIISQHSLEHVHDAGAVLREMRRVLKPGGNLYIAVPESTSLTDRLYRFLFCGGGHLQRFTFDGVVQLIEQETSLKLIAWKNLYSSFIYVERRNFIPAPIGKFPGPFPRRMRWLGRLPDVAFRAVKVTLNVASRLSDNWFHTRLSRDGWALTFDSSGNTCSEERPYPAVCMTCGTASLLQACQRPNWYSYKCSSCGQLNPYVAMRV